MRPVPGGRCALVDIAVAGTIALLATSACHSSVEPVDEDASGDPAADDAGPESPGDVAPECEATIVGRFWISPYPIIVPAWFVDPVAVVTGTHLGTEGLVIDEIRIEGSRDLSLSFPWTFPTEFDAIESAGSGGFFTFPVEYSPSGGEFVESHLVVETSDPTSPTFRVPIVIDHSGETGGCHRVTPETNGSFAAVGPNPVRMDALPRGESETMEIVAVSYRAAFSVEPQPPITGIRVEGPGLAFTGARTWHDVDYSSIPFPVTEFEPDAEGLSLDLEYTSVTGGPADGVISVEFVEDCGCLMTMQAPILIR